MGGKPHLLDHPVGLAVAFGAADTAHSHAEGDVVAHREVGKQSVALEHHGCAAGARGQTGDVAAVDQDFAVGGFLVAGDHPQQGGLATAARPQQAAITAAGDAQIDAVHGQGAVRVALDDAGQFHCAGGVVRLAGRWVWGCPSGGPARYGFVTAPSRRRWIRAIEPREMPMTTKDSAVVSVPRARSR